jgi:hypothetical protein
MQYSGGPESREKMTVALVPSSSGTVIGVCDVVDCIGPLTAEAFRKNANKAGIRPNEAAFGLASPNPRLHSGEATLFETSGISIRESGQGCEEDQRGSPYVTAPDGAIKQEYGECYATPNSQSCVVLH